MKIFLLTLLFSVNALATAVTGNITDPVYYAITSATITTSAFKELVSSTPKASSAIIASNNTSSFLILARGVSGSEVSTGLIIPPREVGILIPINVKKGERLSLKALLSNGTGATGVTFFQ